KMSFLDTLSQMSALFLMVLIGYGCNRLGYMDKDFNRKFSSLILNVTAPFLILSSVMGEVLPKPEDIAPVLTAGVLTYVFLFIFSFLISKYICKDPNALGSYRFMLIFGNINYIGFPVLDALFGTTAIFYAAVVTIPFNILIFMFGVPIITSGKGKFHFNWRTIFSPCLCTTYITIVIVCLQARMPREIAEACKLVGSMTVPGSLLIIGSTLAAVPVLKMIGNVRMYILTLIKLLAIPCILFACYKLSPLDDKYANVLVILFGMPVASIGTMLCLKNNIDGTTMSEGTFLTTLLSVLSIPLLALIL
ncbi:MAG: AEC family transporter, partial [Succinivibrio sp.]|nr:AEC family transporter [Succinivibrio sp.]